MGERGGPTLRVHDRDVVGEFRHLVAGGGTRAGHYLPALAHTLLTSRPQARVEVRDATGPWGPGVLRRCLCVRPGPALPDAFLVVHWALEADADLALGWYLLRRPGGAGGPDEPAAPDADAAWEWAQTLHDRAVVPVLHQVAGTDQAP